MRLLLTIFLLTSCATQQNEAHFEKSPNDKIREKALLYCQKSPKKMQGGCDGLLFASLHSVGCGTGDIYAYESVAEPGKWFRSPTHDCFVPDKVGEQESDSTISKDMYQGIALWAVHKKDKNLLGRTIDYGKSRNWVVGEAKDEITLASKCYLSPSLQSLLKDAYQFASGASLGVPNDDVNVGVNTGFRAHLDVLNIIVKGKIAGSISNYDLTILKEQAKRQPDNALYQAAKARYDDGDYSKAQELLLNSTIFPDDALPNNHENYCTDYLYQRDKDDSDWKPCTNETFQYHDGTDFIFASSIVSGLL